MNSKTKALLELLDGQPVIPVLQITDAAHAAPLARALARGGLRAIEITLRTAHAVEAIRRAIAEVPEAIVGAGTILNPAQFDEAVAAGWFGPVEPRVLPVVGDVVVAMRGAATVVDSRTQTAASIALPGVHGSMTAREMLVPLLVHR